MDATSSAPTFYKIRINGRLDPESASWFEGMTIIVNEEVVPPQTVICGWVRDQANLYGLISRARDLGLVLISVCPVDLPPGTIHD